MGAREISLRPHQCEPHSAPDTRKGCHYISVPPLRTCSPINASRTPPLTPARGVTTFRCPRYGHVVTPLAGVRSSFLINSKGCHYMSHFFISQYHQQQPTFQKDPGLFLYKDIAYAARLAKMQCFSVQWVV